MDVMPYLAYALILALLYLWVVRSRTRREVTSRQVLRESEESGLTLPPSLHPLVDTARCIGCGACMHACPEFPRHQVLGVIEGKADLVAPTDCVGHGACRSACPVNAISLVFGTSERGVDIPMVSPEFETSVPGIFIAGELGGMGLIRNAIEQGRQAMESIITRLGEGSGDGRLDVVVVGAGPAGISATLLAHERGLRYVCIEQDTLGGTVANFPRGKLVMTEPARLPMVGDVRFGEVDKETLMAFWRKVEADSGINVHYRERMQEIERSGDGFLLKTTRNRYAVRCVLLAIGRRGTPRRLNVPGEELPKVVYTLTDPEQYAGKRVLVVGGGDSALEAAHALAGQPGTQVTVSYRGSAFNRARRRNRDRTSALAAEGVLQLLLDSELTAIAEGTVTVCRHGDDLHLPNDAVIICAGGVLPTGLLRDLGVQVETKYGQA